MSTSRLAKRLAGCGGHPRCLVAVLAVRKRQGKRTLGRTHTDGRNRRVVCGWCGAEWYGTDVAAHYLVTALGAGAQASYVGAGRG